MIGNILGSQNIRKCYFWVQSQYLPIVAYSTEYRDNLGRLTQRPKSQRQNSLSPTRNFDDIFFHGDFHLAGIESSRLSNLFFSSLSDSRLQKSSLWDHCGIFMSPIVPECRKFQQKILHYLCSA